ncbi:MAG: glycosyltransferase [bacterium]
MTKDNFSNNQNIIVVSIYSFPLGLAPTNRILAYSKGLVANGVNVCVFMPFPTDQYSSKNRLPNKGIFDSINYCYSTKRYKSKFKIVRAFSILSGYRKISGYLNTWRKIKKYHKENPVSSIIISTDYIPTLYLFGLLAKRINVKSIFIFDEYPTPVRHKLKDKVPKWKEVLYKKALKNISGYVSISIKLKDYFNSLALKDSLVLSTITDTSRYENNEKTDKSKKEYVCYMGNMELSKDNVDNIIKAFGLICKKYPELEFHLYGTPIKATKNILVQLIKELNLTQRVFFKGKIPFNKVPVVLKNAKILVSSQPDTFRASGGFPTKLGEYLASGTPSLITDVGENSKYVRNEKHLFFANPNDPHGYANRLVFILDNYDYALNIAKNGKFFIYNNYSHIKQGKLLLDFINTI